MAIPDPVKTTQEQLVESINRLHGTALTTARVRFGVPELVNTVVNDISDPVLRNSQVQISNAEEEPYEFTTVLHYNRLSMAAVFEGRDYSFAGDITHTHDLLPLLSDRLGFLVTANDIVGHSIENLMGYPLTVLLVATTSSLLLYGQVNVTLTGP